MWAGSAAALPALPFLPVLCALPSLALALWPRARRRLKTVLWMMGSLGLGLWLIHGGLLSSWLGGGEPVSARFGYLIASPLLLANQITLRWAQVREAQLAQGCAGHQPRPCLCRPLLPPRLASSGGSSGGSLGAFGGSPHDPRKNHQDISINGIY